MIWQMSWEGFKERPIFGWGQENFLYVFAKHYNPKMWNQEPWFDRSHDVFFDWLVAGGAVGLLTYLSMFAALIYTLWWKRKHHFSVLERAVLLAPEEAILRHNLDVLRGGLDEALTPQRIDLGPFTVRRAGERIQRELDSRRSGDSELWRGYGANLRHASAAAGRLHLAGCRPSSPVYLESSPI